MVAGLQEISRDISFELSNIYLWLTANRLSLNFDKTKYMIFYTSGCKMDDISLDIRIENNSIERIREFNFLGLTINETMTWSSHVGKIASKIGRTVGVLHKLKHFLPKDVMKACIIVLYLQANYDWKCVRHYIPELLCKTPNCIIDKFDSHSLQGFSLYVKKYLLTKYANECTIRDCYVCKN